ncbi:MAG TPA: hypothetical protein VK148_22310 [Xanthobacteraceae bacterium]|nr:hypothetical protein [Xanthobacteraceae bacterium]
MTKIANIRSALVLTSADAAGVRNQGNGQITVGTKKSDPQPIKNGVTVARVIPTGGKKIDNVFQAGQGNVNEPVRGGFKPVKVPASGNGTQSPAIIGAAEPVKHHIEPMKPMLPMKPVLHVKPAEYDNVIKMLKASGPHHMHDHVYNNWYWKVGGYYLDVDYVKYWDTYSYPVFYAVEKEVEVCETEYKYRLRYVPGYGYERVIVTVCKLV